MEKGGCNKKFEICFKLEMKEKCVIQVYLCLSEVHLAENLSSFSNYKKSLTNTVKLIAEQ